MKLIAKALKCKRKYQYLVIIFTILSTLFCIQKYINLNSRNATILENVAKANAFHTAIYIESKDGLPESYLTSYFNRINKENHDEIIDDFTLKYYDEIFPEFENSQKDTEICFLEGYDNKEFNKFDVIIGKKLKNLKGNEIAVNSQYWKKLQEYGFKLGDTLYNKNKVPFKIESVFKDPVIYTDVTANVKKSFLSQNNTEVIKYRAISNQDFIKKIALTNRSYDNYTKVLYKIKIHNYSIENESKFLTLVRANYRRDMDYNFQPLYFQLQKESFPYQSYKLISGILFISILITNLFIFISIFKKRLEEKQKLIMCMLYQGIKKKFIFIYYASELLLLYLISFISLPIVNWAFMNMFRNINEISVFFNSSQISLIILFICVVIVYLTMLCIIILEFNKFIKNRKKIRNVKISKLFDLTYTRFESILSLKEILAYPYRYLRFVISCVILIGCLSLCITSFEFVTNLYNLDSIGLKYDYIIGNMNKDQFDYISKYYKENAVAFSIQEKFFKEKVSEYDNLDIDRYYNALLIIFYEDIKPFINIQEGKYPKAEHDVRFYSDPEDPKSFLPRNCLTTKKIIDLKDGVINENLTVDYNRKAIGYANSSYETWNGENFMFLDGTVNSIINGGYVAFANVGSRISLKERLTDINGSASMIINLKKNVSKFEFQSYLKNEGIEFKSYDNLIDEMNNENKIINEKLIILVIFIIIIVASVFISLLMTFYAEDKMRLIDTKSFFRSIGIKHKVINGYVRMRYLIILIFILFYSMFFLFFSLAGLKTAISKIFSVYTLSTIDPITIFIFLFICSVLVLIFLSIYQLLLKKNRIEKRKDEICEKTTF